MALNETICEVDLSADGKHCGYIQLPHSVHRSAYGWIPIPIASIRNGAGPSVLLMAGNHGDEYEGQVLLSNLIRELTPEQVAGQVIILPMANFPAAQADTRTSPLDEGNLNRSFPGDPLGRPTRAIANFIEEVLLPGRDLLVDLHSGGSSLNYLPSMLAGRSESAADAARQRALLAAMGLPYALTYPRDGQGPFSSSAAERKGVMAISTELGGAGRVTPDILALGRRGVLRLLDHVGLLRNLEVPACTRIRVRLALEPMTLC